MVNGILPLIIKAVLADRTAVSLVRAYMDAVVEDLEEESEADETSPQWDRFLKQQLSMVEGDRAVEDTMGDIYQREYRRLMTHPVSREEALEVFEFPRGLPNEMPKKLIEAIALAMAKRDAREASSLREHYLNRMAGRVVARHMSQERLLALAQ